jgi:hypothetical protein
MTNLTVKSEESMADESIENLLNSKFYFINCR